MPARLPPCGSVSSRRAWKSQVELGRPCAPAGSAVAVEAGQVEVGRGGVLQGEHDLEQRVAGQGPGRGELLDQPLERHVLVGVGGQAGLADPVEQLAEGRVAGQVGAQHQGVDEEADQVVERLVGAAGDRGADRDVVAGAEPGQQDGQRGLQHHEQGDALGSGQLGAAVRAGRRSSSRSTGAAAVRATGGRGRSVGSASSSGSPAKRLPPVGQLLGEQAVRVVLVAEQVALPQRVVGVLHRQRLPAGRPPVRRAA